ncbi:hypothetical protein GLAREA_07702 [Glarea lozoyensis ATCC 20868]|uniref:Solute carrier family 40 member n=1 Tax=Glarea lozoyensis (strain ATCC 20868 / MF5171) TaxID=1116229 RepID=S3E267_GLAL2|nr:uncharacterized protein GLAREA_07702 [Glarea lozoyensis ATCC 20868]EPE32568.1 hypothetical protein GLAREA_07702 [Glarea lozoyensis ATCC 20868]
MEEPTCSSPIPSPSTPPTATNPAITHNDGMTRSQAANLYISLPNLSFKIIFAASAFPDTLAASSTRGIIRTLASICLSSSIGRWVDKSPHRLKTLSSTISINRLSVIAASILWLCIADPRVGDTSSFTPPIPTFGKYGAFALILVMEISETLSAQGNMLSMERDFVVTAADPDGHPYDLTNLNAVMRRIDLTCKLIAPLIISAIISATSAKIGVLFVGGMSLASWAVELWCAKRVWDMNAKLRVLKITNPDNSREQIYVTPVNRVVRGFYQYTQDIKQYFASPVWIPSFSLALLHLSALSYAATFITFLLNSGISLPIITIARAAGSVVEISSTLITPYGVTRLGKASRHGYFRGQPLENQDSETTLLESRQAENYIPDTKGNTEVGLERLGLWGLTFQFLNLLPVLLSISLLSSTSASPSSLNLFLTFLTLFLPLSLSRLGLWTYDLTTTQLVQTLHPSTSLSAFSGAENTFIAFFELTQHVCGIIWARPEDFVWIASVGVGSVGVSAVLYAGWVRRVRGHLVHWRWGCKG